MWMRALRVWCSVGTSAPAAIASGLAGGTSYHQGTAAYEVRQQMPGQMACGSGEEQGRRQAATAAITPTASLLLCGATDLLLLERWPNRQHEPQSQVQG